MCIDTNIPLELADEIIKLNKEYQPEIMRVVFQDACFSDDVIKTNAI